MAPAGIFPSSRALSIPFSSDISTATLLRDIRSTHSLEGIELNAGGSEDLAPLIKAIAELQELRHLWLKELDLYGVPILRSDAFRLLAGCVMMETLQIGVNAREIGSVTATWDTLYRDAGFEDPGAPNPI